MTTLIELINQAEANEKAGNLLIISPPINKFGVMVCKVEGHSWEEATQKDAIRCSRCGWTIYAGKGAICKNCNFFDCVEYYDYHNAHVKPYETCESFRGV